MECLERGFISDCFHLVLYIQSIWLLSGHVTGSEEKDVVLAA